MGGAGVQRVLKFVKYLPQFGYEPIILTRKSKYPYLVDNSLLRDVKKGLRCYRTSDLDLYGLLKKLQKTLLSSRSATKHDIAYKVSATNHGADDKKKIANVTQIASKITNFVFVPDNAISWLPFAFCTGKKILKKYQINTIFSSSPPYTNHIIGYLLSKGVNRKWIADFRDEWTVTQAYRKFPTKLHWQLHQNLEHKVIENAHVLLTTSRGTKNKYVEACDANLSGKWNVVTNGYDEDDFKNYRPLESKKFRISYIGSFYGWRTPKFFLQAVNEIIRSDFIDDAELNFIGWSASLIKTSVMKYITQNICINISEYVNHDQIFRELARASVLMLIIGKKVGEGEIPGKLFEYIRSAKPVLALSPKVGAAADLIRQTNAGIIVDPEDVEEIKNAVEKLYTEWKQGTLAVKPNRTQIKRYERRALTKELVDIIENKV